MPAAGKVWWLYVLECTGDRLYTGVSPDVAARFRVHAAGKGAFFTKLNPPLRVLGAMPVGSQSEALQAEYAFKKLSVLEKRQRAAEWRGITGNPATGHR